MGTRSAIGYIRPDGSIRAVYCHWDGYPSHQIPILEEHYASTRKVQALIRPGSMSSLRREQRWDSTYTPEGYSPSRAPQPLYHHERGEGPWSAGSGSYGEPPKVARTLGEAINLWRDHCCEWLYVFSPEDGWHRYAI